ncbi:MAG: winged helix DNA-binding domain-containing protein, partial [Anaerolineaceae bacterium]|nr:winged helix DNA-binding domain-containing protein [Anaerolineaceae bacterium]
MTNSHIQISQSQLQKIQLSSMGLLTPPEKPATKEIDRHFIKKMGYLQIDTMQIVARAPYLILWNHLGNYDSTWLDELLSEGHLFEFYAHALCFIPVEEFPYYRG